MKSVSKEDILMGRQKWEDLTAEVQKNVLTLVERINKLLAAYAKSGRSYVTKINDGLRRLIDQPKNAATKSTHLLGLAIDLDDDEAGSFWAWIKDNLKLLKEIGLWIEHPCWTHYKENGASRSWMHFQCVPPKSGNRVYVPNMNPNPNPSFWDGKYDKSLNGMA